MIATLALLAALAPPPDTDRVASVARGRAAALGRHRLSEAQARRLATAILAASEQHRLRPALIMAIIEVESAYGAGEVSNASCKGLMQLNPRTAPHVARDIGLRGYNLHRIEHSVALGAAYLRQLADHYGGRWDFALTAYNVGMGRFKQRGFAVNDYARRALRKQVMLETLLQDQPFNE